MESYKKGLVSVIVPVYNVEKYLTRCLDSICNQTYCNLEIILVDDGSSDNSGRICDEYAKKDKRIRTKHKQNAGVSAARNDGLDIATGDYITFVDSDDYVAPEMYEMLIAKIQTQNADIAVCGYFQEGNDGVFRINWKGTDEVCLTQLEQIECLLRNRYYTCSLWDKLYRSDILRNIRFDESIHHYEDYLFLYEAMQYSHKAVFTPQGCYYYCNNEQSVARSKFDQSGMDIIDVCERVKNEIECRYPMLSNIAQCEFVRNNIMCSIFAASTVYDNAVDIKKLQTNIRNNLMMYLGSYASMGYKIYAVMISISWKLFCRRIKER